MSGIYYRTFKDESGFLILNSKYGKIHDPYMSYLFNIVTESDSSWDFEVIDISNEPISFIYNIIREDGDIIKSQCFLTRNKGIIHNYGGARLRRHFPYSIDWIVTLGRGERALSIETESRFLPRRNYGENEYIIDGESQFSILFENSILNREINRELVIEMIRDSIAWSESEKYWYYPPLLFIIENTIHNIYSIYEKNNWSYI